MRQLDWKSFGAEASRAQWARDESAQDTLDALESHIAILDADGVILAVNRAWSEFALENGAEPSRVCVGVNYLAECDRAGLEGHEAGVLIREVLAGIRLVGYHDYPCHSEHEQRWYSCRVTPCAGSGAARVVIAHRNMTAEKRAVLQLREREDKLFQQQRALTELAVATAACREGIEASLRRITETSARTLDVRRVSIWIYAENCDVIRNLDLFDLATGTHISGLELHAKDYPAYFRALDESDVIAADDARTDPRTQEIANAYFPALGITSMMDAPVHLGGNLHGVLCHEHIGPPREWSSSERAFAVALANLVSLSLEECKRREAEEQLRLHSAALNAVSNGIVITDRAGKTTWVNPSFTSMTGYTLQEAQGKEPGDLLRSGRHGVSFYQELWDTIQTGSVWNGILVNRRKDGSEYHEAQRISPIIDSAGEITHFVSVREDVSERIKAVSNLREAQEHLSRAVKAGKITLWEWDVASDALHYSTEWIESDNEGLYPSKTTMDCWYKLIHPDDIELLRETHQECAREPGTRFEREFRLRHPDGDYRWILMAGSSDPAESGQPTRVLGTSIDITDRKRLEMQFHQAQKMESIGRLAGGIAHDFNNLLGVIRGYTDTIADAVDKQSPVRSDVIQIQRAAERAATLTRQLLAFSRRQVLQPEVLDINAVVEGVQGMLKRLIGENIEFRMDLESDLGAILGDRGQIELILMNLAVNARDAMPAGGRLTFATRNQVVSESEVRKRPGAHPGEFVCIEVADTGTGMDRETLERIFEPFFTTKEKGKGTGLGLATVYGIVKQSGGGIWVESHPDQGTQFEIYFPRIHAVPAPSILLERTSQVAQGTEIILVVEDEEALRVVTQIILSRAGYTVLAAASPEQAIAIMEQHGLEIELLLSDIVMPGMSGPDMAARFRTQYPQLRVLFMSGYADNTLLSLDGSTERVQFIEKPFSSAQLTTRVREVLEMKVVRGVDG